MAAVAKSKRGKATKKPKWSVVTYKKIEARRLELGYSKAGMALALGVTNSTYHNWRRGTTVPHPTQQEQIKTVLAGLTPGAPKTRAAKPKRASKATTKRNASPAKKARGTKKGSRSPGTARKRAGDVTGGSHMNTATTQSSHPMYPASVPTVPGIATITSSWINAHNKAPSAGSVYKFMEGLKGVLHEG